jgi:hypothetical protein
VRSSSGMRIRHGLGSFQECERWLGVFDVGRHVPAGTCRVGCSTYCRAAG